MSKKEYVEIRLKKDSNDPRYIINVENYNDLSRDEPIDGEDRELFYFKKKQAELLKNIKREGISELYRTKYLREYLFNEIKWYKGSELESVVTNVGLQSMILLFAGVTSFINSKYDEIIENYEQLANENNPLLAIACSIGITSLLIGLSLKLDANCLQVKRNLKKLDDFEREEAELVLSKKLI